MSYKPPGMTKEPHILSLMLLSAFAVMGAIILTPSLPEISSFFKVNTGLAQMTVTLFLLGYGGGQLIYGPIANRYGRKPALYLGIIIATIGSLFSIVSAPIESFNLLLLGRLLEALGASAGLVVSFTIINDFYDKESRRITATIMLAFAVVPGVAVLLGGFIAQYLDWKSCFYFLLAYGLILIIPIWRLPETLLEPDHHALKTKKLFFNYLKECKNKILIGFAICSGLSSACIYVFGAEGPFIGIHLLNTPPATYGFLGLIPYVGTFIGSILVIKFSNFNAIRLIKFAFILELTASIIMFFLFLSDHITLLTLLGPMILLCMGHPIIAGTAISLAMKSAGDKSNGSAVMNFTTMSVAMLITFLLGMLHIASPMILPIMFFLSLTLMIATYFSCKLGKTDTGS